MVINWLKLDVNILDDAKIKIIRSHPDGDKVFVLWIGLLCLAMKSARPGIIEIADGLPYTIDDLSSMFGIEKKTVEMGLALFRKYQMVDLFNGDTIEILNFAKHQNLENIEHKRELTRLRTIEYRNRLRDAVVTRHNVTVTPTDKNKKQIRNREDNIGDISPRTPRKAFQIPTIEEIKSYCTERKNKIDAQYFLDYQTARDWILKGGQKAKDWKAVIRTWERNNINTGANNAGTNTNRGNGNQKIYSEQDRLADEINAEYYRRKAAEASDNPTGNTG